MNEDDAPDGDVLVNMQAEMRRSRKILIGLVILATVTASILISSAGFLTARLWNPIEIPNAKFDKDLNDLNDALAGLVQRQALQAATYAILEANLEQVRVRYSSKAMGDLRLVLIERERDNRKLLGLLAAGVSDLSLMAGDPKASRDAFRQSLARLIKESELRERELQKLGEPL